MHKLIGASVLVAILLAPSCTPKPEGDVAVAVQDGTPWLLLRLCPGDVAERVRIYRDDGDDLVSEDEVLWEAVPRTSVSAIPIGTSDPNVDETKPMDALLEASSSYALSVHTSAEEFVFSFEVGQIDPGLVWSESAGLAAVENFEHDARADCD